jgi:DNA-binding transcriptional LysR family regulator
VANVANANWDLFRLFFAVARSGSVSRAAHELGMSQPTLSRRLKEFERYVGAPLFFRATSGVQLTAEGLDLQRSATDMMAAFESFQRDIRSRVGKRSSVVRISASEGLTKHWLLPRVRKLHDSNNNVHLEITATVTQESLVKSDLDFVIRTGDPGDSELIGRRVANLGFGIFASKKYLAAHSIPQTMADLKDHDIIGSADDPSRGRSQYLKLFSDFATAADTSCIVRVTPLINHFAAAAEGLGLACLAIPFARAEGLVQVMPNETGTIGVWLLRRRESDLRKLTRDVRRFLEAEFARSKAWLTGEGPAPQN